MAGSMLSCAYHGEVINLNFESPQDEAERRNDELSGPDVGTDRNKNPPPITAVGLGRTLPSYICESGSIHRRCWESCIDRQDSVYFHFKVFRLMMNTFTCAPPEIPSTETRSFTKIIP